MFTVIYIYGLFNDAVSSSGDIASGDRRVVNDERKRARREAAVRHFEALTRSLSEVTEKPHENPQSEYRLCRYSNRGPPISSQERYCLINLPGYVEL
jgi:hypothetical protein